ncbi:hypothetical protein [Prosthecobacter sp.]|uniref:hypothetical protein n=1 Tax=Prosthecobacter sp. TaxID=1965333 RepID=UPI0037840BF9
MKSRATPPDMTKEQKSELKALYARRKKLSKSIANDIARDSRRIAAIDREIAREERSLAREAKARLQTITHHLRSERRLMLNGVASHQKGTSATQKACAAITRRISILEGRLNS